MENITCGDDLRGYLARPAAGGERPCAIVLHERYGLVQHIRDFADRLARNGYVTLALDLFSRHPDVEAVHRGEVRVNLSDAGVRADLEAGAAFLEGVPGADARRLSVIGMCQTGRYPIVFAAERPVRASVVFYGAASPREWEVTEWQQEPLDAMIARLQGRLLGIFGEADHIISIDDVLRFRHALEANRKSYDIHVFAGAPHGWLNDTMPGRYRREAAEEAWQVLLDFLAEVNRRDAEPERVRWRFRCDSAPDYDFHRNERLE